MITSSANPHIKQIRRLRERKERQQSGLFTIEGLRIVLEAIRQGAQIETLIVAPELLNSVVAQEEIQAQIAAGMPALEVSAGVFASISLKEGPAGVAAVVRQRWQPLDAIELGPGQLWVGLDSVADPGNLGTILRTLDAVGATGMILLDHTTDPYDPTAVRASMGALFSQRLVRCDFAAFCDWQARWQATCIGTSDKAALDYQSLEYPDPILLLMGSERQGLQQRYIDLCKEVVGIPMAGSSDSLNLAVATGVMLYEIFNQRRARERSK